MGVFETVFSIFISACAILESAADLAEWINTTEVTKKSPHIWVEKTDDFLGNNCGFWSFNSVGQFKIARDLVFWIALIPENHLDTYIMVKKYK